MAFLVVPALCAIFAFAWSAFLAGVADAGAIATGGDDGRRMLAAGVVLLASAVGARRPRPAGRDAWLALLWATAAGLALPGLAAAVAGPAAGEPRSLASVVALAFLALVLGWPLARIGGLLSARAEEAGPGGWSALLAGAMAGWVASQRFGMGPRGFILVAILLALSARAVFPGRAGGAAVSYRSGGVGERMAPALFALSATLGVLFLLPYLETFDGSAATEDGARLLSLSVPFLLAAVTLGAAFAETRAAAIGAALLGSVAALGWYAAGRWIERYGDPRAFSGFLDSELVRGLIGGGERPQEGQPGYVAAVTVRTTLLATLALGAALRAALPGSREPVRPSRLLSVVLAAAALGLFVAAFGHPQLTPWRLALAVLAALAGGAAAALAGRSRPLPLRAGLALLVVAAPLVVMGVPRAPRSGVPFFDNFENEVRVQFPALRSLARVIERNGGPPQSRLQLADGRSGLTPEPEAEEARRMEAVFALGLARDPQRALLAGTPHPGTFTEWRQAGVRELHLVTDPPELALAAAAALPGWDGAAPDAVYRSAGMAEGRYGLILLRDDTPWEGRRSVLRPALIAASARRLAPGGVLALALDPERCVPGTVQAAWNQMRDRCATVSLWLLPRGVRTPRLLVAGTDAADFNPAFPEDVRARLGVYGLPLDAADGLGVLLLASGRQWETRHALPLAPPLARALPLLAEVEYRRPDPIRPAQRAARVLADLQEELGAQAAGTLLPFYSAHLAAQMRSPADDSFADTLTTPEHEWTDLSEEALDMLAELTRRSRSSVLLQLWTEIAPTMLHRREVEWCQRYYGALVEEMGMDAPAFRLALAQAALESLDPETALAHAERALQAAPGRREAQWLRARSLAALGRHAEAAAGFRALAESRQASLEELLPVPEREVLRGWAEQALAAGDRETAERVARRLQQEHGAEALGAELARLLGVAVAEPALVHPEGAPEPER
ncbi:MAG: hypothetical protein EYC70_02490 [Planctomycetota bacterium]|nr:MAG: hypothetical protein EYC70_02490 [Planctomycetota bacterium]